MGKLPLGWFSASTSVSPSVLIPLTAPLSSTRAGTTSQLVANIPKAAPTHHKKLKKKQKNFHL
jgi:hypothetical protein